MTEVLKRGRRGHPVVYGGGLPEAYQVSGGGYQVIADEMLSKEALALAYEHAYQMVTGEGLRVGFLRPLTPRAKEIEPLNTTSYFPAETWLENVSFVQGHGGWQDYIVVQPHRSLRDQIVHHAPWDASEWLTRWVGQVSPKETPEHFELSPLSERRTTGKVRKYYEPASFLFVDDDEVDLEDTEH